MNALFDICAVLDAIMTERRAVQEVRENMTEHISDRVGCGKYAADREQTVKESARKYGEQYRKRIDAQLKYDIHREIAERIGKRKSRCVAAYLI